MSGKNRSKKAKVHVEKPELPQFLQRMKEQIVANEDNERRSRADERRRERPSRPDDPDDDPTVVKLGEDDLTEAEYKRMKTALDSQYRLPEARDRGTKRENQELDIDLMINTRQNEPSSSTSSGNRSNRSTSQLDKRSSAGQHVRKTQKNLSYGSSSDEED